MRERPGAERLRPRPVGDRARDELGGPGDDLAALEQFARIGRQLRFDTDHAHPRPEGPDRGRDPAREAAAADRHEDRRQVRQVLDDLEPDRSLAGDDPVVVEGRDDREAAPAAISSRDPLALVAGRARRSTISAPSAATRWRFTSGASDGMTTTAGYPSSRAARATPWA